MNSKFITFLFVATAVLSVLFAGMMIYVFVLRDSVLDEVVVERDGVTEIELVVDDLQLTPGAVKTYDVVLKSKDKGDYILDIFYNETVDGGMKDFVDVQIIYADEVIYDGTLTDLIGGREVMHPLTMERGMIYELTFVYSMPDTIGNEAQKTTTSFDISVAIMKED